MTSSGRGPSGSTGWPRHWARRSAGWRRPRPRTGGSWPTCRTSSGARLAPPLAALVAEASILREHLDALPPDSRRAGELLVADVARLRSLVDDLMELSRF